MIQPKISVVTVCYNAVNDIEKTILSAINQTYPNIEYLIIDGGSTDGTMDIVNKYKDKIDVIVSEPDKGIYDAMNKGIDRATGEWINFMNAGDVFISNGVLVDLIASSEDGVRILRGNIIRMYGKIKVKSCGITLQNPKLVDMFDNTFHHQACLIQKTLFEEYGMYSTEYKLCSDWKFFFDCVVLHHVNSKYVDIAVAQFQMDGASSNGALKYENERRDYLNKLYGNEMFSLLEELSVYRKSKIIKKYYLLRNRIKQCLSPGMFNRLLMLKRIIQSFFNVKVN